MCGIEKYVTTFLHLLIIQTIQGIQETTSWMDIEVDYHQIATNYEDIFEILTTWQKQLCVLFCSQIPWTWINYSFQRIVADCVV